MRYEFGNVFDKLPKDICKLILNFCEDCRRLNYLSFYIKKYVYVVPIIRRTKAICGSTLQVCDSEQTGLFLHFRGKIKKYFVPGLLFV